MILDYAKPSGHRNRIFIPDKDIKGKREDFIAKHIDWWSNAHRMSRAIIYNKLGQMWDIKHPSKVKTSADE